MHPHALPRMTRLALVSFAAGVALVALGTACLSSAPFPTIDAGVPVPDAATDAATTDAVDAPPVPDGGPG